MTPRRVSMPRKVHVNKDQAPHDPLGEKVANVEFRTAIAMLANPL